MKNRSKSGKTPTALPWILAAALLGFLCGFFLDEIRDSYDQAANYTHLKRFHYYPQGGHLIDPIIAVDEPESKDPGLEILRNRVKDFIADSLKTGDATEVSFYLLDLDKLSWVGVNEDKKFVSASLGKVPLMFTFFTKAQSDPSIFKKRIFYSSPIQVPMHQLIPPKNQPVPGMTYTVEELLRNMIVYSDNVSTVLLMIDRDVDTAMAEELFSKLGLPRPEPGKGDYEISAHDYAKFFRMLYRASYLNRDLSEKGLLLLSQSDFNAGIVSGVPRSVVVAHKFGESEGPDGVQLHDCGIVYCPDHPYILCVMTKGKDLDDLESVLKNISRIVYRHYDSQQPA